MSRTAILRGVAALTVALLALGALSACSNQPKATDDEYVERPPVSTTTTSTTPAAKLLTAADVERVSGIAGVQSVPQGASERATGNLNFANDKGGIFLTVTLGNSDQYETSKASDTFGEEVKGVGDAAYSGPAKTKSETPNILVFRKGNDSAALTVFFSGPTTTALSIDQLKELANIIAGRF